MSDDDDELAKLLRTRGHEMSPELHERVRNIAIRLDVLSLAGMFGLIAASIAVSIVFTMFADAGFAAFLFYMVDALAALFGFIGLRAWKTRVARRVAADLAQRLDDERHPRALESAGAGGSPVAISLRESER